jgi:methionyl-tRNA synthetase
MPLADRYIIGKCYIEDCGYEKARGDQCDKCAKLMNSFSLGDPKCSVCSNTPKIIKSNHYYLSLPETQNDLTTWINKSSTDGFWSQNSINITYGFLNEGLKERCITRDLKWGVTVPCEDDPDMKNKIFYVWFDAPIGKT